MSIVTWNEPDDLVIYALRNSAGQYLTLLPPEDVRVRVFPVFSTTEQAKAYRDAAADLADYRLLPTSIRRARWFAERRGIVIDLNPDPVEVPAPEAAAEVVDDAA